MPLVKATRTLARSASARKSPTRRAQIQRRWRGFVDDAIPYAMEEDSLAVPEKFVDTIASSSFSTPLPPLAVPPIRARVGHETQGQEMRDGSLLLRHQVVAVQEYISGDFIERALAKAAAKSRPKEGERLTNVVARNLDSRPHPNSST
jgi:hypothetical protein